MMAVILVGYGALGDPFTCSVEVDNPFLMTSPQKLLEACCKEQNLDPYTVDEILPIADGTVYRQYSRAAGDF